MDGLLEYVELVGEAFPDDFDAARFDWRYEDCYPLARLTESPQAGGSVMGPEHWEAWLEMVMLEKPEGYIEALSDRPYDYDPPVLVEYRNGTYDIGDGWHRFAIYIDEGVESVPVVFGVERR